MFSKVFMILICFISLETFAGTGEFVVVEGIVHNFDKKTVTLYRKGNLVKVPRHYFPKHMRIAPGNKVVGVFDGMLLKIQIEAGR